MKRLIGFLLAIFAGSAAGCGGASEAGPRVKPGSSDREFRYSPESASNVPVNSRKKLPDWK